MHRHTKPESLLRLARGADRRSAERMIQPPYITEEGLVLVDRRSYLERRQQGGQQGSVAARSVPAAA